MACASAGDYFVAWGGYTSDFGGDSNKILYFNFVANQWFDETSINNAIATTTAVPAATPSSSPEPNLNQENPVNNAAAIGGGIAGAFVLGAITGFLVIRHRRRSRNNPSTSTTRADYPYGEQKQLYINSLSGVIPNNNPQWNNPNDNHNKIDSHSATANDPQDASLIPMQVYDTLSVPHKYPLNEFNGPQHISLFVSISGQFDSQQQQQYQQLQQQRDRLMWSRAPQDTSESAMSPIEVEDPAELLAQVKTKHEQRRERIRQEREADLQRFREQWQTGTPEKYS
ncbi:hypothetical protein BGX29_010405 [Mortierella sp. GBA35]|nr:hypothetical protein BGX29_010405 [Mortierella sp. GBA35]